jgi:hypothetical protein
MKIIVAFTSLLVLGSFSPRASATIVCGIHPGEIYFVGVHPTLCGFAGFYYSGDFGETIELRSSTVDSNYSTFGGLLADAAEDVVYRLRGELPPLNGEYLTTDGGYNWVQEDTVLTSAYSSGVIPGEVYIFGDHGKLFYSTDYAESFVCLGDLYQNHGVSTHSYLLNGQEPGEVFVWHYDTERLWRVYHYGAEVQLLANFNYGISWYCSYAASRTPGDFYFLALNPDMVPGGTMHIYHTTDYFQTWTMYEHVVNWEDVDDPQISIIPSKINLTIWPNPTNATFNITYELNAMQDVRLTMYDILGRQVWRNDIGTQPSGIHRLSFADDRLPSGHYFILLQS